MKYLLKQKPILLITVLFCISLKSLAQDTTNKKLVGCWQVKSIEFLQPVEDSVSLKNQIKNVYTCIEIDGKFITKSNMNNTTVVVGKGSLYISPDGKTLIQRREGDSRGKNESAEIQIKSDRKMSLKLREFILNYERL